MEVSQEKTTGSVEERAIDASPDEIRVLARRLNKANDARASLKAAEETLTELFVMFCRARGLPTTTQLEGVQGGQVMVRVPVPAAVPAPAVAE